jgi:hypothetical protein
MPIAGWESWEGPSALIFYAVLIGGRHCCSQSLFILGFASVTAIAFMTAIIKNCYCSLLFYFLLIFF